ncbi:ParB/RepB/Spo0J family partition protein [Tateyamaria omphalii]|uniref:Chromosome partitioning protein ParB n=1 Tax=Tateyamaria omphalii TaxID=299262 RepID=A0A1P8N1I1_9RHOB|nr:ParB/RepB/Spo0J family partition protein [Tateyamaria omphalii]APX14181.1 chromosome partitioning protein ParB [Tateyamaria omphalii]
MSKRRVFDIDFEPDAGPGPEAETPPQPASETRRGPMAAAISENADALTERHSAEAEIRAENDRLAHEYVSLKRDGAIVARVPLGDVAMQKLTRDRSTNRDPDLEELKTSIRDLGLSNPIQVEDTGEGYELIQGFRRLSAYKSLYEETGDEKYSAIPAVLVAKGEALEKLYRRMVDENMVRRDISFAEMGQLASSYARQMDLELNDAIAVLFASAGRQKRHYIGSFSLLMDKLGARLQFPEAIPRALGLKLIKALEEQPRTAQQLNVLLEHQKPTDAVAELAVLNKAVAPKPAGEQAAPSTSSKTTIKLNRKSGAVKVIGAKGKIELQMNRDFGAVDPRKLEAAVRALLEQLDL